MFQQDEAREFDVGDKQMRCQFCDETKFWTKKAQLNTAVMSFFDVEWLNPEATCLICDSCGYVHWFLELPRGPQV
ncbi:MAG: hypothetical protein WBG86_11885 [Polyangiales bacterium]